MALRRHISALCGIALVVGLASVSSATAAPSLDRFLTADKDRVELSNGRGMAIFHARGALFASFAKGSVRIIDLPRGARTKISVFGAERVKKVNGRTTVYAGRNVSFFIKRGWWRARIQGRGIDVGAAVRGTMALSGRAGTYSVRDGAEHDWPRQRRVFSLG